MTQTPFPRVRLGDVVMTNRYSYSENERWPFVNYLDTGNITENCIDSIQKIDLGNDKLPSRARRKVKRNDIVYSTVRPVQRHYGLIKEQPENFLVSTGFTVISPTEKTDPAYVYYYLTQCDIIEHLQTLAEQTVSTYPSIKASDIEDLTIPLPPLSAQRSIAATLSCLDAKIELNRRVNANLEAQAQALFKRWFVDFEPWGGKMPVNWREVKFSSFLISRTEKSNDPAIPLFSVTDKGIFPRSEKFNKTLSKATTMNKIIRQTDLVFGMSREILNWGVMRSLIGSVSSAYNVFAVDCSINSKYLESFIKTHSSYFKNLIRPATREGQGVDKAALMQKSIYLPPDDVLTEYYVIEDVLTTGIQRNNDESRALADVRDTLLPPLMSGEIEVEEAAQ